MMSQSIQPNSYTLTALMKTCVKKEDWSRARELLIIGASTFGFTHMHAHAYRYVYVYGYAYVYVYIYQ